MWYPSSVIVNSLWPSKPRLSKPWANVLCHSQKYYTGIGHSFMGYFTSICTVGWHFQKMKLQHFEIIESKISNCKMFWFLFLIFCLKPKMHFGSIFCAYAWNGHNSQVSLNFAHYYNSLFSMSNNLWHEILQKSLQIDHQQRPSALLRNESLPNEFHQMKNPCGTKLSFHVYTQEKRRPEANLVFAIDLQET